jgi:hypothetical protein
VENFIFSWNIREKFVHRKSTACPQESTRKKEPCLFPQVGFPHLDKPCGNGGKPNIEKCEKKGENQPLRLYKV